MVNAAVAELFERLADLLEITGGDAFRINSYRRAARSVEACGKDLAALAAENALTTLPGIGKGIAEKIQQFLDTGRVDLLDELERQVPPELPALLKIQGLGPKKIALMHKELGVTGVDDLRRVIASGALAALRGFGEASVKKIADGLVFFESSGTRTPLGVAMPIAEALAALLETLPGVKRVVVAGSLRRGAETIGDVDLLCEGDDGERIVQAFVSQPGAKRVLASGGTKGSITVEVERGRELQIDLRVVPGDSFGAALQYFTGSKQHNVRLRERAVKKKWRLNEYGLFDGEKPLAGATEEGIYRKLGVAPVPPELREDTGEFDLDEIPALVQTGDLRGDLHLHTVASDGRCTIDEMAAAAKARGYEYLAITDHSKSSTIANGLSIERFKRHLDDIRAAASRIKGLTILAGCECDILPDGSLDYPDDLLAQCDLVVASVHAAQSSSKVSPTERTLAAIAHPHVTILGHPTGRLINRRPAMALDMEAVIDAAQKHGTALEINASWQRLDLNSTHARLAADAGVMLVINTDAHHADQLDVIRYGVLTARRGWVTRANVLNTKPVKALRTWLEKRRR